MLKNDKRIMAPKTLLYFRVIFRGYVYLIKLKKGICPRKLTLKYNSLKDTTVLLLIIFVFCFSLQIWLLVIFLVLLLHKYILPLPWIIYLHVECIPFQKSSRMVCTETGRCLGLKLMVVPSKRKQFLAKCLDVMDFLEAWDVSFHP